MHHPVARPIQEDRVAAQALEPYLRPLDRPHEEDALLDFLAQGRLVLLGEATHGTHEFYALRASLTRRLITEHGFSAVVAEADWPDAWRVNRHVRGYAADADASQALAGFRRFPAWMWRNTVTRDFVDWLRLHNATQAPRHCVGFYGMDLYSLFDSMQAVLSYLDRTDPQAARLAHARYACFERFGQDSHAYGYASSFGLQPHCEDEVQAQLRDMHRKAVSAPRTLGDARDAAFDAWQNAHLVRNAEEYYRTMFYRRVSSWNLRDRHMAQTLAALESHLADERGDLPRLVVWAHNSHLGDARATAMHAQGEWNLGQLLRERCGDAVRLVGFSTYHGTVTAAPCWDAQARRWRINDGLPASYEALFHHTGLPRFWLRLRDDPALARALSPPRLQRAIGVIYLPQTERASHYAHADLPAQFDALIHLDKTRALAPLEPGPAWHQDEPPETFPSGL